MMRSTLLFSVLLAAACSSASFGGSGGTVAPTSTRPAVPRQDEDVATPDSEILEDDDPAIVTVPTSQTKPPVETPTSDAPTPISQPPPPADDVAAAIDSHCAAEGSDFLADVTTPIPAKLALAPSVPSGCTAGVEFNNYYGRFELRTRGGMAPHHLSLDVDLASYAKADRMRIFARIVGGSEVLVLDSCRLRTATYLDPTDGASRPPEDSIREYRTRLPADATAVVLDFTKATSPTYLRVNGLCDFDIRSPAGNAPRFLRMF